MQIILSVKPHVKAFLTHQEMFGQEPIEITRDSWLGHLLNGFLGLYPVQDASLDPVALSVGMTTLALTPKFAVNQAFLTDENLNHVSAVLEYYFRQSLIQFVRGAMCIKPSEQGAVKRFYQMYELSDEHYDLEAAFKVVQRFRNRGVRSQKQRKSRPVMPV